MLSLRECARGAELEDPDARDEGDHRNDRDDLIDQIFLAGRLDCNSGGGGSHASCLSETRCDDRRALEHLLTI